ncbi:hypothetical protein KAI32_01120 [Candidatus Pacearchaeota archaeon]|nr:hypothetical protein [Candidatus Pacearchaeota archaeon]
MIDKDLIKKLGRLEGDVKVVDKNIQNISKHKELLKYHWLSDPEYDLESLSKEDLLIFLLILDGTSFSYWGEPNWKINYKGENINGARGMILSLRIAVKSGLLKLDAQSLSIIKREEYRRIFNGGVEIPLFEERYQIIREIGNVLIREFDGDIKKLIKLARKDALKLVRILIEYFYFFEDYSHYEGEIIHFNKKAQLFVLDFYRLFGGKGLANLRNVRRLTACADYKLPQVLRRLGILEYSESLAKRIDNDIFLPSGSYEETEIRIKTLYAVEVIKKYLKLKLNMDVDSHEINELLWILGQEKNLNDKPYHKIRTIKY